MAEEEKVDKTEEEPKKAPRTVSKAKEEPKKATPKKAESESEDDEPKDEPVKAQKSSTTRKIVSEGEEFEVEVVNIDGKNYTTSSVYREKPLPGSSRTTKILVAGEGTVVN